MTAVKTLTGPLFSFPVTTDQDRAVLDAILKMSVCKNVKGDIVMSVPAHGLQVIEKAHRVVLSNLRERCARECTDKAVQDRVFKSIDKETENFKVWTEYMRLSGDRPSLVGEWKV